MVIRGWVGTLMVKLRLRATTGPRSVSGPSLEVLHDAERHP